MTKSILLTGHSGYIGSVAAPMLIEAGYDVTGFDTRYFADCTLVPDGARPREIRKDIRNLEPADVQGFDAVIHLAALSNDPIGNLDGRWTEEINYRSTVRLAELAKEAGVRRFLFSSSCIMYGASEAAVVNEDSPLDPKTEYARSKVTGEAALRELADDGFSPTYLRNGTVYGVSPHMRFDTVFNDFLGSAVTKKRITVYSDGKPWRPVVHVQDVVRAFMTVLEAPLDVVHNEAFNNGAEELNHQIRELAEIAADTVPGCELEVLGKASADQRTYKADFGKFGRAFPDFEFKWNPRTGAKELYDAFTSIGLTHDLFTDPRFTRLAWLKKLLASGELDGSLRWTSDEQVAA